MAPAIFKPAPSAIVEVVEPLAKVIDLSSIKVSVVFNDVCVPSTIKFPIILVFPPVTSIAVFNEAVYVFMSDMCPFTLADVLSKLFNLLSLTSIYPLTAYCVGTTVSPYWNWESNNVVLLLTSCKTTPTATPFLLKGPMLLMPDKLNDLASIVTSPVNWFTAKKSPIFILPILSTVE